MAIHLEEEIFDALKSIYQDPSKKDQYGQLQKPSLSRANLKDKLSDKAFEYLDNGKSIYGSMCLYGGKFGNYHAIDLTSIFRTKVKAS